MEAGDIKLGHGVLQFHLQKMVMTVNIPVIVYVLQLYGGRVRSARKLTSTESEATTVSRDLRIDDSISARFSGTTSPFTCISVGFHCVCDFCFCFCCCLFGVICVVAAVVVIYHFFDLKCSKALLEWMGMEWIGWKSL